MSTLRGKLQSIALVDVLQLLHANRKTGELLVTQGKQSGVLYVQNGVVVHAETAKAQGETAAFDILEWDQGGFEFVTTPVKAPVDHQAVGAGPAHGGRPHHRLPPAPVGHLPGPRTWCPGPPPRSPSSPRACGCIAEDRGVLAFLDGYRTFQEIITDSELGDVAVLQVCAALQGAGRLALLQPTIYVCGRSRQARLFRQGDQVKLAKIHEAHWLTMGPYGRTPIQRVRMVWARRSVRGAGALRQGHVRTDDWYFKRTYAIVGTARRIKRGHPPRALTFHS